MNEWTDITAQYEQHKTGRIISGFSFKFRQKKPKKSNLVTLTDPQRLLFAKKLSELPEVSSKYSEGTESYSQFAVRIADMLKDPEKLKERTKQIKQCTNWYYCNRFYLYTN